jgi:hypothetical protein
MSCVDDGDAAAADGRMEERKSWLSLLPRLRMADREEEDGITNPLT